MVGRHGDGSNPGPRVARGFKNKKHALDIGTSRCKVCLIRFFASRLAPHVVGISAKAQVQINVCIRHKRGCTRPARRRHC